MLAGTDAPLDNVATSLHLNLRAQVKYGEEPWQALQTATMLAAKAYGLGDQLGTVEPGKIADLPVRKFSPFRGILEQSPDRASSGAARAGAARSGP
jgi:imidazolonepropionase-like amidohydrolase